MEDDRADAIHSAQRRGILAAALRLRDRGPEGDLEEPDLRAVRRVGDGC